MRIELEDAQIVLSGLPYTQAAQAKEIPGARHDKTSATWKFPLSWTTCVIARGVFGSELTVGPALAEWAAHEHATRIRPAMEARAAR